MCSTVLVGPMGAGKSTIGKKLSIALKKDFYDIDDVIQDRYSKSIKDIVIEYGQEHFRKCESAALKEIIGRNAVIATGGGIVLSEQNRKLLEQANTIFLNVNAQVASSRVANTTAQRYLLNGVSRNELEDVLLKIFLEREILYKEVSSYYIDSSDKSINDVTYEAARVLGCDYVCDR